MGGPRPSGVSATLSMYFFKSISKNSKTRYSFASAWTISNSLTRKTQKRAHRAGQTDLTMFGSSSSLRSEISRMAVLGTPSSSASSRIFLSATVRFVLTSFALYTTPYVPVHSVSQRHHGSGARTNPLQSSPTSYNSPSDPSSISYKS